MGKEIKEIKEYGVDLENNLKKAKRNVLSIENKIRKRAKLILDKKMYNNDTINNLSLDYLLKLIRKIEDDYVNKSKQTELKFK